MEPFQTVFWKDGVSYVKARTSISSGFDPNSDPYQIDIVRLVDLRASGEIGQVYETKKMDAEQHELDYMKRNSRLFGTVV